MNKWWWYLHENWSIQVKRYWGSESQEDMFDAESSPFCQEIFWPISAPNREEAIEKLKIFNNN